MPDEIASIPIPTDNDGYFSCQCPHCSERFKLHLGEFLERDPENLSCPSCGLSGKRGAFTVTDEVQRAVEAEIENHKRRLISDLQDTLERAVRGSKHLEFKKGELPRKKTVPEVREFTDLAEADLPCCELRVKVKAETASSVLYCPYCSQVVV